MTFGTRLRLLREARHLTRRQLGEKTGISPRVIGYYETDQRLVSAVSAIRTLCLALDTTPDYLIWGDPPGARYRRQETSPLRVAEDPEPYDKRFTEEELAVLERAKRAGVTAAELDKAVDMLTSLRSI
jgi:transcriptional regulator with XRE-family HTH domain